MRAVINGAAAGTAVFDLVPGAHLLGSGPGCILRLGGDGVAARHARIEVSNDGVARLCDLGSVSGTRVNGERIVVRTLAVGDLIEIGPARIRLRELPPVGAAAVSTQVGSDPQGGADPRQQSAPANEDFLAIARTVHQRLVEQLDLRRRDVATMSDAALREVATSLLQPIVLAAIPDDSSRAHQLLQFVLDEALGLGPLESLLADDAIREIMVNGPGEIYIERAGSVEPATRRFSGEAALRGIVERIVAPLGRRVDEASPMVDARLPDGSRVNVVIPPLAIRGTAVTIRRFGRRRLTAQDLVAGGSIDARMLQFLEVAVRHRRNLIVCGGTGSGKTTLLNVLSSLIPRSERVITIEDSAELAFDHPNLVALETRPPNLEGRGEVSVRDLVRNALRMRPDRIVIGECRGGETLDMLQAMNTGHDGSLSTVHANSPRELLSRLEVMALMSGIDLPLAAIREQIAASIHLIVHQTRFAGGARRVTRITEVTGVVSGTIQTQDLFRFESAGTDGTDAARGRFLACGHAPQFYAEQLRAGHELDTSIFTDGAAGRAAAQGRA
jgi:pilus assembly protein CpaF